MERKKGKQRKKTKDSNDKNMQEHSKTQIDGVRNSIDPSGPEAAISETIVVVGLSSCNVVSLFCSFPLLFALKPDFRSSTYVFACESP